MARRFFQRLRDAVCEQCIERANDMIAEKHYSLKIAKLGLKSLRIATGRSSLIGRQARIHSKVRLTYLKIFLIQTSCISSNIATIL